MTWLEIILNSSPESQVKFAKEFADSYSERFGKFLSCLDELDWFVDHGLTFRYDCDDYAADQFEPGDCSKCYFCFLTDPEIYRLTTLEVPSNDV